LAPPLVVVRRRVRAPVSILGRYTAIDLLWSARVIALEVLVALLFFRFVARGTCHDVEACNADATRPCA
jgi:hypothetical protein